MEEKFKYSESFMQNALNSFFAFGSVKYNIDGLYVFDWESDKLLETKSGYIYEFEIKISRADFKNDFKHKKDKHIILEYNGEDLFDKKYLPKYYECLEENKKRGDWAYNCFRAHADNNPCYLISGHKRPNYFYYAVPTDMIKVEEVPSYDGLVYIDEKGNITTVKKAPCIHKEKYKDSELNFGEKFYYNMDSWRNKCKKAWKDMKFWKDKLDKELESKGQLRAYKDLENELDGYKEAYHELSERERKSKEQLHRDLYHQNRMVSLLAREIRKYNPEFNFFEFEKEHFGENK